MEWRMFVVGNDPCPGGEADRVYRSGCKYLGKGQALSLQQIRHREERSDACAREAGYGDL